MDYTKIPEELKPQVREWIASNDIVNLIKIHNEYKLTPFIYHCCNASGLMKWYREGIATNQI